jgi:hypothetical protein
MGIEPPVFEAEGGDGYFRSVQADESVDASKTRASAEMTGQSFEEQDKNMQRTNDDGDEDMRDSQEKDAPDSEQKTEHSQGTNSDVDSVAKRARPSEQREDPQSPRKQTEGLVDKLGNLAQKADMTAKEAIGALSESLVKLREDAHRGLRESVQEMER